MSFVDNELFDDIIVGEYRDDDGKVIKNVYTTKDDAALVIGLSTFENLLVFQRLVIKSLMVCFIQITLAFLSRL